jgi:hypothetical protein
MALGTVISIPRIGGLLNHDDEYVRTAGSPR